MADKGRWSIVNPAGEEVTFESREDLKRAVLEDEIEPHAESIPPDPRDDSRPPAEPPALSQSNRPTPFMGQAEVLDAETRASVSNGRAAMLPSESTGAEEAEPPSSAIEMDEPTLQYSRPESVPPRPSVKSPPEDEGSPLSLSEVGGVEAPPSVAVVTTGEEPKANGKPEKLVINPDDSVSLSLPLVGPSSAHAVDKAGKDEEDDSEGDDEKTAEMEVEASELATDEDAPETPKRPAVVRETTPPPLPVADRRSSKPFVPPLPAPTRSSGPPPLQRLSTPHGLQRLSPPPRISMKPENAVPVRGSITPPSLPPPDIVPDAPARTSAPAPAPVAATATPAPAPAKAAPTPKPSWLVPIALVGIGIAFWLSTKSNHVAAPENATKEPKAIEAETPVAQAAPVAVSSSVVATPAAPPAEPEEPPPAAVSTSPAVSSAQAPTPPVAAPQPPAPPASHAPAPVAAAEKPRTATPSAANPTPAAPAAAADPLGPQLRRAAQVQRNGDYGAARQIYQALLTQAPRNPEVLTGLGDTSRALGDKAGARGYYTRALDASSSFLPALLGLADTEWDLGERVAAQKHYADIVEHHTNAPERARQRAKGGTTP